MALPFPLNLVPWDMFPSLEESLPLVVIEILVVFGAAYLAGYLKMEKGVHVGYTRKIFHFAVFSTAGVMMWHSGYGAVLFLGGIASIFILIACYKSEGFILYEGIAREDDYPNKTYYILVPFLATALGGIISIYFFGVMAVVGFFVAGWGDAAGEPVGTAFGRHRVSLPFFGNTKFTRSLEGSIGVAVVSFIAAAFAFHFVLEWSLWKIILVGFAVSLTAMFVELFSPHGIDNFTVQVFATTAAYWVATVV